MYKHLNYAYVIFKKQYKDLLKITWTLLDLVD